MFELEYPLLELIFRGAFLFILFMVLFRILPRRTGGELGPMDLVFLFLITEAASHSLGDFTSLTDGTVQILTFMALNYATSKLSFLFPAFERMTEHEPLPIIKDGKAIPANLRKESITADELIGGLRLNGIDDITQVKVAYVESDGKLSVVKKDGGGEGSTERNDHQAA